MVLCRVVKRLSYIEDARCLKVKSPGITALEENVPTRMWGQKDGEDSKKRNTINRSPLLFKF